MPPFKQPSRFKEIDLYYTEGGDFFLDTDTNDLADTKNDLYRTFIQRLDTRMNSGKGDWKLQPTLGVGLTDFLGKKSTQALARAMQDKIYSELLLDNLLRPNEFSVQVLPITPVKLAIVVFVRPPNSLGSINRVYYYDLRDNKVDRRVI